MIWHNEIVQIPDSQDNIQIVGELYNCTVTISILWKGSSSTLFTKIISGLRYEEPTEEDVEAKFGWKIEKFKSKLTYARIAARFGLIKDGGNAGEPDIRDA